MEAKLNHPALKIHNHYHTLNNKNYISPYITTIYALDILREGGNTQQIADYILWYSNRANKLDVYGVSGTIYDLSIDRNGTEHPLDTYDSADGYAGLYLYLVAQYYQKTKDIKLLKTIWHTLKDDIYLILHLQDKDGLTKALAPKNYSTKFLMDNIEAYIGVKSFLYLSKEISIDSTLYNGLKNTLKSAILHELYNNISKEFYWAKDKSKRTLANRNIFYPDIFIKVHLLAFWGDELDIGISKKLWQDILYFFNKNKPALGMEQAIIFNWAKSFAIKNNL